MSLVPNPPIAAEIGHWIWRRNKRRENRPLAGKKDSEPSSMSETRFLSVAAAEFEILLFVVHIAGPWL